VFSEKLISFVKQYIHRHEKINQSIRKIMRSYARVCQKIKLITCSISNFTDINEFQIADDFKIDGCYVQSMNSLM
jgi:hypothetical protein